LQNIKAARGDGVPYRSELALAAVIYEENVAMRLFMERKNTICAIIKPEKMLLTHVINI